VGFSEGWQNAGMENDPLLFFRIVSGLGAVGCVFAAMYVFQNASRFFGVDPEVPSENASARSQTQLLVAAVLAHAFAFCLAGMVFL